MNIIYKSRRIGKNGRIFELYKFRTLKENSDKGSFAQVDQYTRFGKFLRKTKIDELPQLWNVLKGDMTLFGYRAEEERTWNILPTETRNILALHKPGIIDLASLFFYDEEKLMQISESHRTYWEKIRPLKLTLQMFYLENKCLPLKISILWIYFKKALWSIIKK